MPVPGATCPEQFPLLSECIPCQSTEMEMRVSECMCVYIKEFNPQGGYSCTMQYIDFSSL